MSNIGKTADGVLITHGLRVWTNDLEKGSVDLKHPVHWEENQNPGHPDFGKKKPWFRVVLDRNPSGRGVEMSPDRVVTRHPGTRELA